MGGETNAGRRVGEDRVPAVQGVRQPREGDQVHGAPRRAAEGPRLDGSSRVTLLLFSPIHKFISNIIRS